MRESDACVITIDAGRFDKGYAFITRAFRAHEALSFLRASFGAKS